MSGRSSTFAVSDEYLNRIEYNNIYLRAGLSSLHRSLQDPVYILRSRSAGNPHASKLEKLARWVIALKRILMSRLTLMQDYRQTVLLLPFDDEL